jgi:hypothetical protein
MTTRLNGDGSEEEDALLSAILYLHRQKQRRALRAQPNSRHARVLDHFQSRARRLQEERLATEEVLERVHEGGRSLPPARPQQELVLSGVARAISAGRLRIRNRSERVADFELCAGDPIEGTRSVPVAFEPARGTLEKGGTLLVRVAADLARCRPGDRLTVPIECRWRTGRDRIWLVIEVDTDEEAAR